MRVWLAVLFMAIAGLSSRPAIGDTAERSQLQARCWTPSALGGVPREKKSVRGNRTFDRPPPAAALAPYMPVGSKLRGAIRRVKLPPGQKLIALTFDLCEQTGEIAGYDAALIDTLRRHGVPATIFAGGKWMRSHDERTRQLMADPLFEIANHAEAHRNLRLLKGKALIEEIAGPQRAYEAIRNDFASASCVRGAEAAFTTIPARMGLFRFPFGACNATSLDAVNDAGLLAIQWDLSTGDSSRETSAKAIAANMMRAKAGSIVLAHANGRGHHTAEALAIAIPALKAKGFTFVTVSALLAQGTPETSATCYNARPGDTDRYDLFFTPRVPRPKTTPAETTNERGATPR